MKNAYKILNGNNLGGKKKYERDWREFFTEEFNDFRWVGYTGFWWGSPRGKGQFGTSKCPYGIV
jgi:hypothetical protein